MLVTGLPGAHNDLIDPPPALVSIIIYPNIIIILRRTLVKNKWKNLYSKRIDQRNAPEWTILHMYMMYFLAGGPWYSALQTCFHVYGKHYPCFYCDWRAKEGKEGLVLPDIRMDHTTHCYTQLTVCITRPLITPSSPQSQFMSSTIQGLSAASQWLN